MQTDRTDSDVPNRRSNSSIVRSPDGSGRRRPNFVVIIADDHGSADFSALGIHPQVRTPRLDALMSEGVFASQGYGTAPQCVPSRVAMLTGRYQQRCGVDNNQLRPLPLDEVTVARRLSDHGYFTGIVGKWQFYPKYDAMVEGDRADGDTPSLRPAQIMRMPEFNRYGPEHHGFSYIRLADPGAAWKRQRDRDNLGKARSVTREALAFLDEAGDRPFFLMLAHDSPHFPMRPEPDLLERFPQSLPEPRRQGLAMLAELDEGVGQIVDRLKDKGLAENTMVVYLSDHGGALYDEDVPEFLQSRSSGSSNEPWLGGKGVLFEGGVRTPMVMSWPAGWPRGVKYDRPVSSMDLTPTILAAAGVPLGDDPRDAMDGVDLTPYFNGQVPNDPHERLYWRFMGQASVRGPRFKLVLTQWGGRHLFDLGSAEPREATERVDVIGLYPEVAAELEADLRAWTQTLAKPGLFPDFGHSEASPNYSWTLCEAYYRTLDKRVEVA